MMPAPPPEAGAVIRMRSPLGESDAVVLAVFTNLRLFFAASVVKEAGDKQREELLSSLGAVGIIVENGGMPASPNARLGILWFPDDGTYIDMMGVEMKVEVIAR
jgi:hypothetical protein